MGFRILYRSASKFKYITQTIAKITDITPLMVNGSGLTVRTLSPDKTTMVSLNLPVSAFEEFECTGEYVVPVSSDELNKTVRRGTRNDMLEFTFEDGNRELKLSFIDTKLNVKRTFSVPIRDVAVDKLPEPKIKLTVSMRMLAEDFKSLLGDAKIAGDEVEFLASKDKVEVKSITPQREYYSLLTLDKPLISLNVEQESTATYAIDLLEASLKAVGAAESIMLEFGQGLPMRITFELPTGGTLVYIVAPRIKE